MKYQIGSGRNCRHASGVAALLLSLSCGAALSAEIGYGLEAGAAYSDNVFRSSSDKISQTIAVGGANFSVLNATRRFNINALGEFKYLNYLDNAYDPELIGGFSGIARLAFVPDRFEWFVEDNFGTVRTNQFVADTPDNRENINYLSTGPEITLPLGTRTNFKLTGRYSNVAYEKSPIDENRYGGDVELSRALSEVSALSLKGTTEKVRFDRSAVDNDYRRDEYYGSYTIGAARTQLTLDAGYTKLVRADSEDGGVLARLGLSRRTSPASVARLVLGREFSNSGASLRELQSNAGVGASTLPVLAVENPFTSNYVTLSWDFVRGRTQAYVSMAYHKADYETQPTLNRNWITSSISLRRQIGPVITAYVGGDYFNLNFDVPGQDYSEIHGNLGLIYQIGARLYMDLRYERFGRNADVSSTEYRENEVWLTAVYAVGERRTRL